jgi:hypothetical protein
MKKSMCECSGCRKTATAKTQSGRRICEDHLKEFRRLRRSGKKITHFFKEKCIGHLGDYAVYADIAVKI